MPNIGTQPVRFKNSVGTLLYTGSVQRDSLVYPISLAGDKLLQADIDAGLLVITLSTGVVISPGSPPPLAPPAPTGPPAYSQFVSYMSAAKSTQANGALMTSADFVEYSFFQAPVTAANYTLSFAYQTNFGTTTPGETGSIYINSVLLGTFDLEGASGGSRTVTRTVTLTEGANTVRIQGNNQTFFLRDLTTITRPAGA